MVSSNFKFDSQHVFLTYAQSALTCQQIYDHLSSIKPLEWAVICQERHKDGNTHQHAIALFIDRLQTRNCRLFDVAGQHPNILPVRSIKHAIAYVRKQGEFVNYGAVPAGGRADIDWVALAEQSSEAEFLLACSRANLQHGYAKDFWRLGCRQSCEVPETYEADLDRERWDLQLSEPTDGTTVVVGPSGVGKTSWAKRVAKKPALWVRHLDVLRSFRPRYHKSIIFDDMSFSHLPREAQIHLVDETDEAHIHCRYGHAIIPGGTQKIFTANYYPFTVDSAIERRVNLINLVDGI